MRAQVGVFVWTGEAWVPCYQKTGKMVSEVKSVYKVRSAVKSAVINMSTKSWHSSSFYEILC